VRKGGLVTALPCEGPEGARTDLVEPVVAHLVHEAVEHGRGAALIHAVLPIRKVIRFLRTITTTATTSDNSDGRGTRSNNNIKHGINGNVAGDSAVPCVARNVP